MSNLEERIGGMSVPEISPASRRRRRLLIGCAIGCASFFFLGILGCLGLYYYLSAPGQLLNEHSLLSSNSSVFLRANLNLEDAGLRALTSKFIDAHRKQGFRQVAPDQRNILLYLEKNPGTILQLLREMVFVQVVVIGEPGNTGKEEWLVVVSLKNYPNQWRIGFGLAEREMKSKKKIESYRGHTILLAQNPEWGPGPQGIAMIQNHLVFGSTLALTRSGVDRILAALKAPVPFPGTPEMKEAIQSLNANNDLLVGVTNESGGLTRLLKAMKDPGEPVGALEAMERILEIPASNLTFAALDADIQSEEKAVVSAHVKCNDPAQVPILRDSVDFLVAALAGSYPVIQSGIVMQHQVHEESDRIRLVLEVNRIWDWVEMKIEQIERAEEGKADGGDGEQGAEGGPVETESDEVEDEAQTRGQEESEMAK